MKDDFKPLEETRDWLRKILLCARGDKRLQKMLIVQLWCINRAIDARNMSRRIMGRTKQR